MGMRTVMLLIAGLESLLLSSCFVVTVPLKIVEGTAKAGAKAATATKDAFSKSDEEKEKEEKKKQLKEEAAEKEKKKQEDLKNQQTPQQQDYLPSPQTPPSPADQQIPYHPTITPDMLKKGKYEPPVAPTPVPGSY
jgi:hypothetical protein